MKTNVKLTKIRNCPTTTQLKLMHWLMHLELSGGSGEGAGADWDIQPESLGIPFIEITKTQNKTNELINQSKTILQ